MFRVCMGSKWTSVEVILMKDSRKNSTSSKNEVQIAALLILCGVFYCLGVYGAGSAAFSLQGRNDLPLKSTDFFLPITVFSVLACMCFFSALLYRLKWKRSEMFVLLTCVLISLQTVLDLVYNINTEFSSSSLLEPLIVGLILGRIVYLLLPARKEANPKASTHKHTGVV